MNSVSRGEIKEGLGKERKGKKSIGEDAVSMKRVTRMKV